MSIKIMSIVWEDGPSNQSERFVLLAIADYANDEGECWPSIEGIMRKTCMSDRGVQKIIRRLEADGWLSISVGSGRRNCNVYTIKNPEPRSPRTTFPPNDSAETPNDSAINPEPGSPEPSLTINKPSVSTRVREILASILSEATSDNFIAHRKAIKKPLTEVAARLIVGKLDGCRDPDGVANTSIMNGWAGVFPERDMAKGKSDGQAAERAKRAADRYADRQASRGVDIRTDRDASQPLLPAGNPK